MSPAYEPWIGDLSTGPGCRLRWGVDGPICGAPVTLHVLTESAARGKTSLSTCETHASVARAAGVWLGEHSPSFPGCDCAPIPGAPSIEPLALVHAAGHPVPVILSHDGVTNADADVFTQPSSIHARPPYDPALKAVVSSRPGVHFSDGDTHYAVTLDGQAEPLCGYSSDPGDAATAVTRNWRLVSCPICRWTETP